MAVNMEGEAFTWKGMVKVEAVIRLEKLDEVKKALEEAGYFGLTVYEVRGRGEQRGVTLEYRGVKMSVDLIPKVKLEVVVPSMEDAERVARIIMERARTGRPGDGRIFIVPVLATYRIRTGEKLGSQQDKRG